MNGDLREFDPVSIGVSVIRGPKCEQSVFGLNIEVNIGRLRSLVYCARLYLFTLRNKASHNEGSADQDLNKTTVTERES